VPASEKAIGSPGFLVFLQSLMLGKQWEQCGIVGLNKSIGKAEECKRDES
jgi:hypothetical protein